VRPQKRVELIQNNSGSDANGPALEIQIRDEPQVAREINDDSFAEGATNKPGPGAAGCYRDSCMRRGLDDSAGLAHRSRKGHAHWFDLVNRGIGGVKLAGKIIESDVTIGGGEGSLLLRGSHRTV